MSTIIPLTVVGACSGIRRLTNAILNIKKPTKLVPTILRTFVSLGMCAPKFLMSYLGIICYKQWQEIVADKFACEHAASKEELEAFRLFFIESFINERSKVFSQYRIDLMACDMQKQRILHALVLDPWHPHPLDRAAMVQEYINQWDEESKS